MSKSEIVVLKQLCGGNATAGELAQAMGSNPAFVSRLIKSLCGKGLLSITLDGTFKRLALSEKGLSFKQMYYYRKDSGIERWLSGRSLELLVLAAGSGDCRVSLDLVVREMSFSKPTLYAVLRKFRAAGIASVDGTFIIVSDRMVAKFANDFADGLVAAKFGALGGFGISLRLRKHAVLRIDRELGADFSLTGLNALANKGLGFIKTTYNDYYFSIDGRKRELPIEECFVHALLLATLPQHQDFPLLAGFLKTASERRLLDLKRLRQLARDYYLEGKLVELQNAVSYAEKIA